MSNNECSIQSMHFKAWSEMTTDDGTGSISKMPTSSKKLQFIFDPGIPPLPNATSSTTHHKDTSSVGNTSTMIESEFKQFQTKMSRDLAANLKECRSLASLMADDGSQKTLLDEMCADRASADARMESMFQANQQMMLAMQQMFQTLLPPRPNPSSDQPLSPSMNPLLILTTWISACSNFPLLD